MTVALLTPLSDGTVTTSDSDSSSDESNGSSQHASKALVAHAICGGLATMIFLPLAVLVPRISRGLSLSRWWFPVHGLLAGLVGAGLVVAAYALGQACSNEQGNNQSVHPVSVPFTSLLPISISILTSPPADR
jgi:hypothetical protein